MAAPCCCWKWTLEWWPCLKVHLRVNCHSRLQTLPSVTLPCLDHLCDSLSSLTPSLFLSLLPFLKALWGTLELLFHCYPLIFTTFFSVNASQISILCSIDLYPGAYFQLPMEKSPLACPACTSNSWEKPVPEGLSRTIATQSWGTNNLMANKPPAQRL